MVDNLVFNTNLERLTARFPDGDLIGIKDAAAFCGCDYRTLEARKDFPVIRLGASPRVPLARFARWLSEAEGRG